MQRKHNDYFSVISSIHERVAPIIAKNEKTRERSDRDRDRSDRKKDSDKEKDKKPREGEVSKESKDHLVEIKKETAAAEVKDDLKVESTTSLEQVDEAS